STSSTRGRASSAWTFALCASPCRSVLLEGRKESAKPFLRRQLRQADQRPWPVVADHLRRRQAAEAAAVGQGAAAGQAEEEAGGVLVAGAGGVDHRLHRQGRDLVRLAAAQHQRALLA